jgi:hypothetical protein
MSAISYMATEAAATATLEKKVAISTICILPVHNTPENDYEWKEGRLIGYKVFTNLEHEKYITLHSAHDTLYTLHLDSKLHSDATKTGMTANERLTCWTEYIEDAYLPACGEGAKDVTVINEEEAKRLVTLKSSKWYQAKEPFRKHSAI